MSDRSQACDQIHHDDCDGYVTVMEQDGANRYVCACGCHRVFTQEECPTCSGKGTIERRHHAATPADKRRLASRSSNPSSTSPDRRPPGDVSVETGGPVSREYDDRSPTPLEDCWWESCEARLSVIVSPTVDGVTTRFCMVHRGWHITNTRVLPADTHSPGVSVSACVALVQELAKLNDPHGYPGIAASIFAPFVKKARAAVGADVPAGSATAGQKEEGN